MQDITLHRATDIVYQKKEKTKDKSLFLTPSHLILRDISTTLYRGEVLGVLGEYSTLKYLKDIYTGHLTPDSGRVKYNVSFLSLDVEDHLLNNQQLHVFLVEILEEYMNEKKIANTLNELKRHPLFYNHWEKEISLLSRQDIAVILVEISRKIRADITLYNNFFRYLNEDGFKTFKEVVNGLESDSHGVFLFESKFEPIEKIANHFLWLSYGQMRFEGTVKEGRKIYDDYLKQRSQIRSLDEEALFDLEWKERMYETSQFKHGLKRRNKKYETFIDKINIQRVIITFLLIFTMVVSFVLIVMDLEFSQEDNPFIEEHIEKEQDDVQNRTRYGFVISESLSLGNQNVPQYALIPVTKTNNKELSVIMDDAEYDVSEEEVLYFNPASMYDTIDYEEALEYMSDTFRNNYLFYTNYLNEPISNLEEDFTLSKQDDYRASIEGTDITFYISKGDVIGLSTSGTDSNEISETFNVKEDYKIFIVSDGYLVYDKKNNNWVYLSR